MFIADNSYRSASLRRSDTHAPLTFRSYGAEDFMILIYKHLAPTEPVPTSEYSLRSG